MEELDEMEEPQIEVAEPEISLHAITGTRSSQTMQIRATVEGCPILILVDSGSTHNFISAATVQQLGIAVQNRSGIQVSVANGEKVPSQGICEAVTLKVHKNFFVTDLFVLPLDGFDVVLGVIWLKTLGPIIWDFSALTMSFGMEGRRVVWHGENKNRETKLQLIQGPTATNHMMEKLLTEFADLFEEPRGLPPSRACDHRIHLLPDSAPIAVRPYRYPHLQKNEIEQQCATMLEQGIIRPSHSPFSSPVLLVPKKDGGWRLCVDYRALNDKTVKDKFPIPVVEELLEELHGAKYYTKMDLRSGYHQVRMAQKTLEKLHSEHITDILNSSLWLLD